MLLVLHYQLHDHGGRRGEHGGGVHQAQLEDEYIYVCNKLCVFQ